MNCVCGITTGHFTCSSLDLLLSRPAAQISYWAFFSSYSCESSWFRQMEKNYWIWILSTVLYKKKQYAITSSVRIFSRHLVVGEQYLDDA